MEEVMRLRSLKLEVYLKPGTTKQWLLPVCGSQLKDRLLRLRPANPGNWESTEIDGCPTECYRLTYKLARAIGTSDFKSAWGQLRMGLGTGPAEEFFPALRLRYNNLKARDRIKWESHHGGIRHEPRFNRGMSVRAAARLSIV